MIEIQHVSHAYGRLPVLSDVTFSVAPGEFVSVLGPSGCGKTTLLKIVSGLVSPASGTVSLHGDPVSGPRPAGSLGFVFQRPALLPWRTARQNVALPLELHRNHANQARDPVEVLRMLGLEGFEDTRPHELSGGMQHRVALARALVFSPPVLLMDEPFSALDELLRERLDTEVLELTERLNQTVLFVTHSVSEAVLLSDRIVVLSERPAQVHAIVGVDLPRPRERERRSVAHLQLIEEVRAILQP